MKLPRNADSPVSHHQVNKSRLILLLLLVLSLSNFPLPAQQTPSVLRDVGFDQKLDSQLPLDSVFRDENGRVVQLKEYFGRRPVILSFAYHSCPMLCKMILDGMARGLRGVPAELGTDYLVVNISIDPRDSTQSAMAKKIEYTQKYSGNGASQEGWHFLTGEESEIRKVTDSAGFRYAYDPVSEQYAHVSGIVIATPHGRISRYFYGITYSPRDLRLGLAEASGERIGSPVDRLLLFCYHYDALTGRYSLLITRVVQVAGTLTVVSLGLFWFFFHRHAKRRRPAEG